MKIQLKQTARNWRYECQLVRLIEITPKALANSSPGLLQPWGLQKFWKCNAEGVGKSASGSSRTLSELYPIDELNPGFEQPWAEIGQRFQHNWKAFDLRSAFSLKAFSSFNEF